MRRHQEQAANRGSQPGPVLQPPSSLSHAPFSSQSCPPGNGSILVYASTQQLLTDINLTAGYEILLNSPTENPLKQENLESCLAIARTKMEDQFGASANTQFTVQISTEVRVQNMGGVAPPTEVTVPGKEDEQKERVKRETFSEFVRRNPHFFSEQEDRLTQHTPLVSRGTGG